MINSFVEHISQPIETIISESFESVYKILEENIFKEKMEIEKIYNSQSLNKNSYSSEFSNITINFDSNETISQFTNKASKISISEIKQLSENDFNDVKNNNFKDHDTKEILKSLNDIEQRNNLDTNFMKKLIPQIDKKNKTVGNEDKNEQFNKNERICSNKKKISRQRSFDSSQKNNFDDKYEDNQVDKSISKKSLRKSVMKPPKKVFKEDSILKNMNSHESIQIKKSETWMTVESPEFIKPIEDESSLPSNILSHQLNSVVNNCDSLDKNISSIAQKNESINESFPVKNHIKMIDLYQEQKVEKSNNQETESISTSNNDQISVNKTNNSIKQDNPPKKLNNLEIKSSSKSDIETDSQNSSSSNNDEDDGLSDKTPILNDLKTNPIENIKSSQKNIDKMSESHQEYINNKKESTIFKKPLEKKLQEEKKIKIINISQRRSNSDDSESESDFDESSDENLEENNNKKKEFDQRIKKFKEQTDDYKMQLRDDHIKFIFEKVLKHRNIDLICKYRHTTKNEFQASEFHRTCDQIKESLIICRSEDNMLFGGINFINWNKYNVKDIQQRNFLFSLGSKMQIFNLKKNISINQSITYNKSLGPIFGEDDLIIGDDCINEPSCSSNLGNFYEYNGDDSYKVFSKKKGKFLLKGIMIFSIEEKIKIPEDLNLDSNNSEEIDTDQETDSSMD